MNPPNTKFLEQGACFHWKNRIFTGVLGFICSRQQSEGHFEEGESLLNQLGFGKMF